MYEVSLRHNSIHAVASGRAARIRCEHGQLWVSISGDDRDFTLDEGDALAIAGHMLPVVQAFSDNATFSVEPIAEPSVPVTFEPAPQLIASNQ